MRIGINVPDDLLDRVKEVLPAGKVSQFFREALQDRIQEEQRIKERVRSDDIEAEIARLARETALPPEPDWVGLALDNAANWVRNVTPEDWDDFVETVDDLRRKGMDEGLYVGVWTTMYGDKGLMDHLGDYSKQLMSAARPSVIARLAPNAGERGQQEYTRAWLGYMYEVRRLIEQRRKEQYERIRAEYDVAMRARREPEAPEHLI